MPQLYAFQPKGHGPSSFFVIAESVEDALIRVAEYIAKNEIDYYYWRDLNLPYAKVLAANKRTNGAFNLTTLNPGEVIDNDNS